MRIVADIGGTHARFAVLDGDKPSQIKKYLADHRAKRGKRCGGL